LTYSGYLPSDYALITDRPAEPESGRKRRLRSLIGLREEILDWVPQERQRYTLMGLIVTCTAGMAAFSMIVALHIGTRINIVFLLPIGLAWGCMIAAIDSWLISSTHGLQKKRAWMYFVPRLVLSIILGAVIAEPVVLLVFSPSINAEIAEYQKRELDTYEAHLRACNPTDGSIPSDPTCTGSLLSLPENPGSIAKQIADTTAQRDQAKTTLDALNAKYDDLEKSARDECAGSSGEGLTGQVGMGPQCIQDEQIADQFRLDNHLEQQQQALDELNATIGTLTDSMASSRTNYGDFVSEEITNRVEQMRHNLSQHGLPDEFDALSRLTGKHPAVGTATWALRALLIAVDVMPVLTKMLGRTTAYDALLSEHLDANTTAYRRRLDMQDRADASWSKLYIARIDQTHRMTLADMERWEYETSVHRMQQPVPGNEPTVRMETETPETPTTRMPETPTTRMYASEEGTVRDGGDQHTVPLFSHSTSGFDSDSPKVDDIGRHNGDGSWLAGSR